MSSIVTGTAVEMDGRWYNFKTMRGVDFGAGVNFAWNHTSWAGYYEDPGPPAWTFTAPAGGALLTVLDGGEVGDVYNLFDFGVYIGTTSPVIQPDPSGCGPAPVPCLADVRISRGIFQLRPGPHSITINIKTTPYADSFVSWFRVEASSGTISNAPLIRTVVSAAGGANSPQPTIEPGSWASVFGTNLAAKVDSWTGLIQDGMLPTNVGGVSVSVDGQAAYLSYVSPTQINLQVPDTHTGRVTVVVNNNNAISNTMMVQADAYAPAFFQWGISHYAVATRHPDNGYIGGPLLGQGYVSAKPGDVVTLWGTGFGPVTPVVPPGMLGPTAAATVATPTVAVGPMDAEVLGAALSPGLAGVYQIAFIVPAVVDGDVPVQARVAGVSTPANVFIHVQR